MMLTVTLPLYLLVIANAALIVAAAFAVMRVERALRESSKFWNSPTGAAIKADESDAPDRHSRLIELKIAALQKAIEDLGRRAEPPPESRVIDLPLEYAVRMAKRGASVDDLTRDCGLNAGEAELLHRLHGRRASAPPMAKSA